MRAPPPPSRRAFGRLIAGWAALLSRPGRAEEGPPRDRGIRGTGAAPETGADEGDRGIGGTGVIGTIRRFGSIYVNGLRIAYPPDVAVTIDGAPARAADLRVGHVVRTVAEKRGTGFRTRSIEVASEVVGRVETVGPGRLTVLGQTIATDGLPAGLVPGLGERVAVFGQRRPDGTIVASLIEPRDAGPSRVAGPVSGAGGGASIGTLRLVGVDPALIGQRIVATGVVGSDGLQVRTAAVERAGFGPGIRRLSVEGFVQPDGAGLRFGSGLRLAGARAGARADGFAVVTGSLDRQGRAVADTVRMDRGAGPARPGRGPGDPRPGDGSSTVGGRGGSPDGPFGRARSRPGPEGRGPGRSGPSDGRPARGTEPFGARPDGVGGGGFGRPGGGAGSFGAGGFGPGGFGGPPGRR